MSPHQPGREPATPAQAERSAPNQEPPTVQLLTEEYRMTYPTSLPRSARVLEEVSQERACQDAKWGEQNHPDGTGPLTTPVAEIVRGEASAVVNRHYAFGLALQAKAATDAHAKNGSLTYADIFLEEVFEALAEDDPTRLRAELIQVAAVAVAWVEAIDRRAATGGAA